MPGKITFALVFNLGCEECRNCEPNALDASPLQAEIPRNRFVT
jgi:hypothetical protein